MVDLVLVVYVYRRLFHLSLVPLRSQYALYSMNELNHQDLQHHPPVPGPILTGLKNLVTLANFWAAVKGGGDEGLLEESEISLNGLLLELGNIINHSLIVNTPLLNK